MFSKVAIFSRRSKIGGSSFELPTFDLEAKNLLNTSIYVLH